MSRHKDNEIIGSNIITVSDIEDIANDNAVIVTVTEFTQSNSSNEVVGSHTVNLNVPMLKGRIIEGIPDVVSSVLSTPKARAILISFDNFTRVSVDDGDGIDIFPEPAVSIIDIRITNVQEDRE